MVALVAMVGMVANSVRLFVNRGLPGVTQRFWKGVLTLFFGAVKTRKLAIARTKQNMHRVRRYRVAPQSQWLIQWLMQWLMQWLQGLRSSVKSETRNSRAEKSETKEACCDRWDI